MEKMWDRILQLNEFRILEVCPKQKYLKLPIGVKIVGIKVPS